MFFYDCVSWFWFCSFFQLTPNDLICWLKFFFLVSYLAGLKECANVVFGIDSRCLGICCCCCRCCCCLLRGLGDLGPDVYCSCSDWTLWVPKFSNCLLTGFWFFFRFQVAPNWNAFLALEGSGAFTGRLLITALGTA